MIGNTLKTVTLLVFLFFLKNGMQAQSYSLADLENLFIANNYTLLAQQYGIKRADAAIIQAKLWPNPSFSLNEVNLWKNSSHEVLPTIWGAYGQAQQISMELEQLVETAGKRKKRIVLKKMEREDAVLAYEELIRELKKQLRQSFYRTERIESEQEQLKHIIDLYEQLQTQYATQAQKQNVSQADYYRVQTELVDLQRELMGLETERLENLSVLRLLAQLPTLEATQLQFTVLDAVNFKNLPADMLRIAMEQNIGLKRQVNTEKMAKQNLLVERANRKPDVAVQAQYDRGGNIMTNFIGVGISMDLPVFNRNKGNIKEAQYAIEQERTHTKALKWELENTLVRLQAQCSQYRSLLNQWAKQQVTDQQKMWDNYNKHLQNRQITLLEFIDFTSAYKEAQQAQFQVMEEYKVTIEELQYLVGVDF